MIRARLLLIGLSCLLVASGCGEEKKKKSSDDDEKKTADTATATAKASASEAAPPPPPPPSSSAQAPVASGSADAPPPDAAAPDQPFVEVNEEGQLSWHVEPDGDVSLTLGDKDGKALDAATSSCTLKVAGKETKLEVKDGELRGNIGALSGDLTTVEYTAKTPQGKTWKGVLHLPPGGTKDLATPPDPKEAVAPGTKGPNGGVVDVVGGHRIEIVQDGSTGQIRVYFLNDKNQVMPAPKGVKLKLGIQK